MINFCPMCGTKTNPTKRFCKECGLDLTAYKEKLDKIAVNADAEASTPEEYKILNLPETEIKNIPVVESETEPEKITVRKLETNIENKTDIESKKILVGRPETKTEDQTDIENKIEPEKITVRKLETNIENKTDIESKKILVGRPETKTEDQTDIENKIEPEKITVRKLETNAENKTDIESKKILVGKPETKTEDQTDIETKIEPEKITVRKSETNAENKTDIESKKILVGKPETKTEDQTDIENKIEPEKIDVSKNTTTDTKTSIETKLEDDSNLEGYNNAIEKFKLSGRNIENLSAAEWLNAAYQSYLDKDFESALKLFEKAANLGNADALCWQGRIYDTLEDDGGEKDAVKSFNLYQKAADAGSIFAMNRCGIHYILGDSVQKDTETGMALIKKAADNYYKFAYAVLANESNERSKKFRYAKKFIATNDPNSKTYFGFLMSPELAFMAAVNPKDKTAKFPFFDYDLTFSDTTALMARCTASFAIISKFFVPRFQKFYNDSGKIENVMNNVKKFGNDMLVEIAEKLCIKGLFENLGKNDVTAKDLVFADSNNLKDMKGKSLSQSFNISPAKIWSSFVKNILKQYNKSTAKLENEQDEKINWQDVGGYDYVNRIFNIVKSGNFDDNYKNFNSIEDIFKSVTFDKDSQIYDAYLMGLLISIEILKFRSLAIIGFNNQLDDFEKSEKIIENLKKRNFSDEETKEKIRDALILSPTNFNIYEYALKRLGDPEGDLEYLALSMSLEMDGKFSETKKKILFERLENNPNISNAFKDILFNDTDPVATLSNENFSTLKQDFRNIVSEAAKLQVPTIGDNKFCQIFDIYKTAIKSFKADKHSESRIKTFEHANENFKSFEIPEGVTEIGGYAFANCQQLEKIKFPSTLKKIDAGAFYNCNLLTIELPYGIEEISINLSNRDSTVDTVVYLPNSLQRINGNYLVTSSHTKFVFDTDKMPFINDYFKYTCRYDELVSVLTEDETKNNCADQTLNTNDISDKDDEVSTLKDDKENVPPVEENVSPVNKVDSKKIMSKKDLLLFREELFEKYGNMRCVYFPNKSQKSVDKLNKIFDNYAAEAKNEIVILFYDDTIFGSATDGFLVTDKAIYYHNASDNDNVKYRILLNEISTIIISNGYILVMDSVYEYEISTKLVDTQQKEKMAIMLQEIKNALMG